MIALPFRDREDAAKALGDALAKYRGHDPLVLAIPRGGVPIGRIVADALGGDLDVVLVRKLGAPGNPELAIGAVDDHGSVVLNENAERAGADRTYIEREAARQLAVIRERSRRFRTLKPAPTIAGRTVIVVDDGLATGATMQAALQTVRAEHPSRLVCAIPVAARDSLTEAAHYADEAVCLATPTPFRAVGVHYKNFGEVSDDQAAELLRASPGAGSTFGRASHAVRVPAGTVMLEGELAIPAAAQGLVLFVHGSGSSRHSVRNRHVAGVLQQHGIGTLLFDLLTPAEDAEPRARFDIPLLARRLEYVLEWVGNQANLKRLPIGLFGASTGAAAALSVAATSGDRVAAVVSRGGRPDLVGAELLAQVHTPVMLIVGGSDWRVLELNRSAKTSMGLWAELVVIPGATHLFEEPGALETIANYASDWYAQHFRSAAMAAANAV
ncbi:phosphoribosyltransferase [Lysobacter arvi]|nr:phosphoribosyltransferase [Lysobacter arvi]